MKLELVKKINLAQYFNEKFIFSTLKVIGFLLAGLITVRVIAIIVRRFTRNKFSDQMQMLIHKVIIYTGNALIIFILLSELGVELTPILGAAGVLGIAFGIASKTSLSNIISGFFLISEKPFAVNDLIKLGNNMGIVSSIDLLSVKIRTFDNLFIRIPNELIINSELTNITKYPIRRMDISFNISIKNDFTIIKNMLMEIALNNFYCLREPEPLVLFNDFNESGIQVLFGIWFKQADYVDLRNSILETIVKQFEIQNMKISFPNRVIIEEKY